MSDKNKLYKFLAKTAIIGASIVAGFAIITKFMKKCKNKKNDDQLLDIDNSEDEDDDFDMFDFAEIGKDSPREYVSININERVANEES